VASIGAASLFSDAGHEIATAVLPSFLTGVLCGSAATLGLIEGLSDALLGLAKLVSGPLANQPTRRVQLARGGYLLTAVFTAAIGLATTVWKAGALRAGAWVARGARTPARDAMLAGPGPADAYGRSFGGGTGRRQPGRGGRPTAGLDPGGHRWPPDLVLLRSDPRHLGGRLD
jgi:hypothetical protein